jgi:hypothetical protein
MFDLQLKNKLGTDTMQKSVRCETQQNMCYNQIPH